MIETRRQTDGAHPTPLEPPEPRTLRASVWPAVLGVVFCGFLVAIFLSEPQTGWIVLLPAWTCLAHFLLSLSPRNRLELYPEGFRYGVFWRTTTWRWSDLAAFSVCDVGGRSRRQRREAVGLIFSPACRERINARPRDYRFRPYDRLLLSTYGRTAGELAMLLERWRLWHAAHPTIEAPLPATKRDGVLLKCLEAAAAVLLAAGLVKAIQICLQ